MIDETHKRAVEAEISVAREEHRDVPLGYKEFHNAALDGNPEHAEKLTLSAVLSALFLGTPFTGPIIFGFTLATPILVQLSEKLGGANISFRVRAPRQRWDSGQMSDIFGRRYIILFWQPLTILGGIIACTAQSMNQLIAGEVILGASIGTVSVAYAGISEILHKN